MCACKYLRQRVRRTEEKNGKSFRDISKQKRKQKTHKEIEFHKNFIQD